MINRPVLQAIEHRLYVLCFDDYSADSFTSGLVPGEAPAVRWLAAVDTLYRLAVCGLIWSPSLPEGQGDGEELIAYMDVLSMVDPFPPGDLANEWLALDVIATRFSAELL